MGVEKVWVVKRFRIVIIVKKMKIRRVFYCYKFNFIGY